MLHNHTVQHPFYVLHRHFMILWWTNGIKFNVLSCKSLTSKRCLGDMGRKGGIGQVPQIPMIWCPLAEPLGRSHPCRPTWMEPNFEELWTYLVIIIIIYILLYFIILCRVDIFWYSNIVSHVYMYIYIQGIWYYIIYTHCGIIVAEFSDIKEMCFVWGLALKCLSASLVNGFDPATPVVVDVYNVGQRLHICGSNKPTRGFVNKQNFDEPSYTSLTGNNTVNPIPNNPI